MNFFSKNSTRWHCIPSSLFVLFYPNRTETVGCHRVSSHRDSTGLSLPWLRNNYLSRSASSENERGLRLPVRSLNGARKGARNGRILRDATLRLRQQKGPRKADPWLRSCGGKGESKPERVVGQARGSCLRRWSALPANSWHANIDYVLPYQRTLPPIPPPCSRIFLFIFFRSCSRNDTIPLGKVITVIACGRASAIVYVRKISWTNDVTGSVYYPNQSWSERAILGKTAIQFKAEHVCVYMSLELCSNRWRLIRR